MRTLGIRILLIGLLTCFLTLGASAQRRLPLPVNPDGIRSGEAPLIQVGMFTGSATAANDGFGEVVASTGGLLVVGSPAENVAAVNEAGAVYVFQPNGVGGWDEIARLKSPTPSTNAHFGASVALYGDGLDAWIVVGAPDTSGGQTGQGKLYIFKPSATPGIWEPGGTLLSPQPNVNGHFATSIDIWDNGTSQPSMLVGAPGEIGSSLNSGAVYLYQFVGGLPAGGPERFWASDEQSGALYGETITHLDFSATPVFFVGAPGYDKPAPFTANIGKVYGYINFSSYTEGIAFTSPGAEANGWFGKSLSAYPMGVPNYALAVGAPTEDDSGHTDAGRVYLMDVQGEFGTVSINSQTTLTAGDPANRRRFGIDVDLDFTEGLVRLLIGAATNDSTNPGRAYLFDKASGSWAQAEVIDGNEFTNDFFGASVSLEEMDSKTHAFIGAPLGDPDTGSAPATPGAAYIYLRPSPGITITPAGTPPYYTYEDGSGNVQYNIVLNTPPTGDVSVQISYDGDDCVFADPIRSDSDTTIFNAFNWNSPYTVTVLAVDDAIAEVAETCTITHTTTSTDPAYDALAPSDIVVDVISDDTAGVTISILPSAPYTVSEDGTQIENLSLHLTSEPTNQVRVNLAFIGDQCVLMDTISRDSLYNFTFSPSNWNVAQNVDINAVDDLLDEGTHNCTLDLSIDSENTLDSIYGDVTIPSIGLTIIDNDGLVISGVELVRNASMEDPVPGKPEKPQFWIFKKFAGADTRVCGVPEQVFSGSCSVQFGGNATGPRAVLRSTRTKISLENDLGLSLSTDDTVRVQFKYKLSGVKSDAVMRIIAFRNFGGDRTVIAQIDLPHPGDSDYTQWLTFDQTFPMTTTNFKQLRLVFKDFSKKGKWWVDDVSLLYIDNP